MLCWGTNLQFVEILEDKRAETVYQTFVKAWVARYGPPTLMVVDQGNEFREPFASKVGEMGIQMHTIDVRSPWQNGRTERAGGLFKARLESVLRETTATSEEDIDETCAMHNRFYNRSGYPSPARTTDCPLHCYLTTGLTRTSWMRIGFYETILRNRVLLGRHGQVEVYERAHELRC